MPAPPITLQHLKTSRQYEGASLINRYWFQWSDRRQLGNLVIRLELISADGNVITNTSIRLPKARVTGYAPATDTSPQKPMYDTPVWIQIDDVPRPQKELPTSFRFYTVTGFSNKSETVMGKMDGKYEDISSLG